MTLRGTKRSHYAHDVSKSVVTHISAATFFTLPWAPLCTSGLWLNTFRAELLLLPFRRSDAFPPLPPSHLLFCPSLLCILPSSPWQHCAAQQVAHAVLLNPVQWRAQRSSSSVWRVLTRSHTTICIAVFNARTRNWNPSFIQSSSKVLQYNTSFCLNSNYYFLMRFLKEHIFWIGSPLTVLKVPANRLPLLRTRARATEGVH